MDGGGGHPLIREKRLEEIGQLMQKGVGLCCVHYAVEIPKDKGGPELLKWIGGYYETGYSINPHWVAKFETLPKHPIARGVKPFAIRDEWYFNIRFREGMSGVDPILIATPPDESRRTAAAKEHPGRRGGRGLGRAAPRRRPRLRLHRRAHPPQLGRRLLPHAGPQRPGLDRRWRSAARRDRFDAWIPKS